ncbi:Patched domain-containing protein 3 [Aphelenchoides fujianensis]|nr:Patched domain-containing protein 3 [Aphelenchoides fujianensis]
MPRIYAHFGYFVGLHPLKFVLLGLLLASLSIGLKDLNLEDNVRDGYTPKTSRARQESDIYRSFLNSTARDGGSMHRLKYLQETWRTAEFLKSNLSVPYATGENGEVLECRYKDFCGSFCNSAIFLRSFMWAMEDQIERYQKGKALNTLTNLSFPLGRANSLNYHLESYFFGVKMRDSNDTRPPPTGVVPITNCHCESPELTAAKAVSWIDHVDLVMLVFRGDFIHPEDEAKMRAYEMGAYEYVNSQFKSDLVECLMLGNDIVDFEMKQDGKKMSPYFAFGFALTIVFVVFTVVTDSIVERVLDRGKFMVAVVVLVCPFLSITTTFGLFGFLGHRVNSVALITPFLIMGIGVNDAFLLVAAWHRTAIHKISIPQRMGLILEDVGPSITYISLFCRVTAIALALCYVFTLLLFVPILCYASRLENPNVAAVSRDPNSRGAQLARLYDKVAVAYCKWIMHPATGIVVCLLVVSFLCFAIVGFIRIDARLDTEKILPFESPIREPHKLIAHKVWTDYYPVTVFVNEPVDLGDPEKMSRLKQMAAEFEAMDKFGVHALCGRGTTRSSRNKTASSAPSSTSRTAIRTRRRPPRALERPPGPFYKKLDKFLASAFYKHYRAFLKIDHSFDVPVRRFWFTIIYHNTTNWDERIELMLQLRAVADRYEDLGASVWEVNGMFVDQMLSLKGLTYYNGIITIACMALMCCFFISQWFLICLAVLSVLSITIEVIGCLSWWGLDLGSRHFVRDPDVHRDLNDILRVHDRSLYRYDLMTNQHRVIATLEAVGWPTVQAGMSTLICVLPLVLLQNYIPLVFVKTIALVVVCGLAHGLIIMPSVFALSWSCLGYLRKVFGCEPHRMHSTDGRRGDSLEQKQPAAVSFHDLLASAGQAEKADLLGGEKTALVEDGPDFRDSSTRSLASRNANGELPASNETPADGQPGHSRAIPCCPKNRRRSCECLGKATTA